MFYDFPVGITLDEVRSVIADHNARCGTNAFIEKNCGDHVIFNYVVSFADSFPQPDTDDPALNRAYAILRECRGLIFDTKGQILARRYHKFFNVNEKSFTQAHLIDWSRPHVVVEKLDGSMITPFRPRGANRARWGTKMGATDVAGPVEDFVHANPAYDYVANVLEHERKTPIFEWCSRKQKIVIDYPEDQLILTAVRDNDTGRYLPYAKLVEIGAAYGIPVVRALDGGVGNINEFLESTKALRGMEGYIIRFDNGHMLKVKAEEYCRIHGTKDTLQFEKDVWRLILDEQIDDLKPFMDAEDLERVERFEAELIRRSNTMGAELLRVVAAAKAHLGNDRKRFATEFVAKYPCPHTKPLLFALYEGRDPGTVVRSHMKKHTGSGPKLNIVRPLVDGLNWDDYRDRSVILDD